MRAEHHPFVECESVHGLYIIAEASACAHETFDEVANCEHSGNFQSEWLVQSTWLQASRHHEGGTVRRSQRGSTPQLTNSGPLPLTAWRAGGKQRGRRCWLANWLTSAARTGPPTQICSPKPASCAALELDPPGRTPAPARAPPAQPKASVGADPVAAAAGAAGSAKMGDPCTTASLDVPADSLRTYDGLTFYGVRRRACSVQGRLRCRCRQSPPPPACACTGLPPPPLPAIQHAWWVP